MRFRFSSFLEKQIVQVSVKYAEPWLRRPKHYVIGGNVRESHAFQIVDGRLFLHCVSIRNVKDLDALRYGVIQEIHRIIWQTDAKRL